MAVHTAEPVTVTVARRVTPGHEREFEKWADGILRAASTWRGFLGGGVLRPPSAGQDWHIVYRFATEADLQRWECSPERARWLSRVEDVMDERGVHRTSGLETWFELPGRTAPAPPRWKMALVTYLAIVPLVLAMNVFVLPHLAAWPMLARTLVFSATLTTLNDVGRHAEDDEDVPWLPVRRAVTPPAHVTVQPSAVRCRCGLGGARAAVTTWVHDQAWGMPDVRR